MHDAANDLQSHVSHHNFLRETYGFVLGLVLFFNELSKTDFFHTQVFVGLTQQPAAVVATHTEMYIGPIPFANVTTVGAFILICFNIFRIFVEMYDRFKPSKKRGARKMPGDSKNPKIVERIINAAKAIASPAKNPSKAIFASSLVVFGGTFFTVILSLTEFARTINGPAIGAITVACVLSAIIANKHNY